MITERDILFYAGGAAWQRYGTPCKRTARVGRRGEDVVETFTRTGSAWFMGRDGLYHAAAANILRPHWVDADGDGVLDTLTLLLEDTRDNECAKSEIDNTSSPWSGSGGFTLTSKTPLIQGALAYGHEQNGGAYRAALVGTFTGNAEVCYLLVENVDATRTDLVIYDSTGASTTIQVRLTWSTGAASVESGSGTAEAVKILDEGPNGGEVYLLAAYYSDTVGNTRQVWVYPTGGDNSVSAIPHHVQLEEAAFYSSPIYGTSGPTTRNKESCSFPFPYAPEELSVYTKHVESGDHTLATNANLWQLGHTGSTPPFVRCMAGSSSGWYRAYHHNGTTSVTTADPAGTDVATHSLVETNTHIDDDGSLQFRQLVDSGTESESAKTAANALASAWASQELALVGLYLEVCPMIAMIIARGDHAIPDFQELLP